MRICEKVHREKIESTQLKKIQRFLVELNTVVTPLQTFPLLRADAFISFPLTSAWDKKYSNFHS